MMPALVEAAKSIKSAAEDRKFWCIEQVVRIIIKHFSVIQTLRQGPNRFTRHHFCLLKARRGDNSDDA